MMALEEYILDPREEYPRDITMHLINFLDFIEYNFSTIVLMVAVQVLLISGISRAFPLTLLHVKVIDALKKEVVLRVGIFAIE